VDVTAPAASGKRARERRDGLFAGPHSIRVPGERRTALLSIVTVPATLTVVGLVFHGVTATQVALLFVFGMVLVSLTRGRLLGSGIRARREEFPQLIEIVERSARRLGIPAPQVFVRDDFFVPANAIGLGEPYALVLSSQYLQLFDEPEELAFAVGRELGHIAAGNTRLSSLIVASGRSNPIVASLFGGWLRQTEYSADRAGLLCSSLDAAVKSIAIATFHASGKRVEAAMLADQRTDLVSDPILRWGELTGLMPYAVNRVRALETFAAGGEFRYWTERLACDPLPVRTPLGPADGPVERRELASNLRRGLALLIDVAILSIISDAAKISVGAPVHHLGHVFTHVDIATDLGAWLRSPLLWYVPYAATLVAATGRTIGMMVFDLQVVTANHGRAGVAQSVWRYALALVSALCVVPVLYGLWAKLQPHDRFSGTRLIGARPR
jgi:uncharacterized RDD family membrane protein YckC